MGKSLPADVLAYVLVFEGPKTSLKDVAEGTEILSIPMRLALTDQVPGDAPSKEPPEMRLAAKLLREVKLGSMSVWHSYVKVIFL